MLVDDPGNVVAEIDEMRVCHRRHWELSHTLTSEVEDVKPTMRDFSASFSFLSFSLCSSLL